MSQAGSFGTGSGPGSSVTTLTGNSGGAVPPTGGNINVIGAGGITVTGDPGTSTLTITGGGGGGFTWNDVTTPTQVMAVNNGYIANDAGGVTFTLPATAAVGDVIRVVGGLGQWTIEQNDPSQVIHFGSMDTTPGSGGSLASFEMYDAIEFICMVADTDFVVLSAQGNIEVA